MMECAGVGRSCFATAPGLCALERDGAGDLRMGWHPVASAAPVSRAARRDVGYKAGVMSHTVETHIYRLRQKIEIDPSNCRLLMTAPGDYRLDPAPSPILSSPGSLVRRLHG